MAGIERTVTGRWSGDLKSGSGEIDAPSGALDRVPFTFATWLVNAKRTNPEALIAAARAACSWPS
ncbi:MAG: hypothetical protein HY332_06490 [Chloroflexi bacterium]|nr:hypothetical protein [Chloroflexota bacterium]